MHCLILKCDVCGKDKYLRIAELEKAGIHDYGEPGYIASIDEAINKVAGRCPCGGNFDVNAVPRCPNCRSDFYDQDLDWGFVMID